MNWLLFLPLACTGIQTYDSDGLFDSEPVADSGATDEPPNIDADEDGLTDEEEGRGNPAGEPDTDGDGVPDWQDRDSDGDGRPDKEESVPRVGTEPADTDGDGTPDHLDTDTDADGLLDREEALGDTDGDGIDDWRDPRSDLPTPTLTLVGISTVFNSPVGIDVHEPTNTVVMSVHYPSGNPSTLERVGADGTHTEFSTLAGLTEEVKIATARTGNPGGFTPGDLFVGNGVDGQIVRVFADGSGFDNPWVDLPGEGNGLMRGSLYVDRTGVFGGDLVVCTTTGQLWRIDVNAQPTLVANVPGVHLEGLVTVPNAPARYGPLAGRALAGAEGQGLLYGFLPDGTYETWDLGVKVEDIEVITPRENFFGVNFGTSKLLGAKV